jgi:ATP-dependent DNA helicase RecG
MEDRELEALLGDIESDRAERKATLSDRDRIREAICAFANDLPNHRKAGVVFVGVHDDGTPSGVEITDQLLLTLADMRSDGNVTPFPTMLVQKRTLRGCDLAVVVVQPADAPPVRYKGRVYVRVGPRRAIATPEEERRLTEKRRARDLPFDIRPLPSANVEDLDLEVFQRTYLPSALAPEVLEQNQRTVFQQLSSLRFVGPGPDANPTPLGLLVAGKDVRHFVPGAYIQFVRFDGLELTDPIKDQKEIDGPLTDLLRMSEEVFEAHVSTALDPGAGLRDARSPDYPIAAFRQLVSNAVLHRTYEGTSAPVRVSWFRDRIEILSPGGPYGQVNRANFGDPGVADYRNPHLAEAMKNLGYIQRFGLGIQIARRELERNGNPALEFKVEDSFVWAILRRRP